ncbi:MAG: hypothetical protein SF162_10015 [bacterium]|nr:hypothetical protein [bacterium]
MKSGTDGYNHEKEGAPVRTLKRKNDTLYGAALRGAALWGLALCLLMGCAPALPEIPTLAALPTVTPTPPPTETPLFTPTPTRTPTITPTVTTTPTVTPTFTASPTITPSPTLTDTPPYGVMGTRIGDLIETAEAAFVSNFERHVYTFTAQAGEQITIRMRRVDDSVDPALLLVDPVGTPLASDDNAGAFAGMGIADALLAGVRLPVDGEYAVQAVGGGGIGRYVIALERDAPEPVVTAPPPTLTPVLRFGAEPIPAESGRLNANIPVSAQIERAGELDRFFIAAEAGQALTLALRPSDGSRLRPRVEVYDLDGQAIALANLGSAGSGGGVLISPLFIDETGSYGVYITGENDSTGGYTLAYGVGAAATERARDLLNADQPGAGALDVPGLRDIWSLDLRTGDRINVDLRGANGITFDLIAPDGLVLAARTTTVRDQTAFLTGRYQLHVTDSNGRAAGAYSIAWSYWLAAPTETPIPPQVVIISAEEVIDGGGAVEYAFSGRLGWRVRVRVEAREAFDPVAALFAPGGLLLAENDDSGGTLNPYIEALLPADGTYRVRVSAYGSAGGRAWILVDASAQ